MIPTDTWVQRERSGDRAEEGFDPAEMPSQALTSKARSWTVHHPTHYDRRQGNTRDDGTRDMVRPIPVDEPAPTLGAAGLAKGRDVWVHERPSTAVCADPRISPPGYRGRKDDYDAEGNYRGERSMDNAVRVTLAEAAILQGFPPDYPFQGSRTKQFEQVGNAVPPPLAQAVIEALVGEALRAAA